MIYLVPVFPQDAVEGANCDRWSIRAGESGGGLHEAELPGD